jgi:hypothetical protein
MSARRIFGWALAVLWLCGIQYYVYLHETMDVFWIVLVAWIAIGLFTLWNARRRATK